jgi:predicted nucleic acid-binding protein
MKVLYLDTSALVKRYYEEPGSGYINHVFEISLYPITSIIAYPEVLSALSRKKRERNISIKDYNLALKYFKTDWFNFYIIGELTNEVIETTTDLFRDYTIRGFDAIHLATALVTKRELNASLDFLCSDKILLDAAKREGLKAINPALEEKR